jgi:catechol 2,3-dioxygenase-like lactoylglutathione lyase family enzyme
MHMSLEVVLLPVSDVDRAKEFYRDKVGFQVDLDGEVMPGVRIVQLTPPGSGCSIALADGLQVPTGTRSRGRTTASSCASRTRRPRTRN